MFLSKLRQHLRVRRIQHYESLLQRLESILAGDSASAEECIAARKAAESLAAYYESRVWKRDFSADEAGLLPPDLKRGVLSEDGIYNALEAYREWSA